MEHSFLKYLHLLFLTILTICYRQHIGLPEINVEGVDRRIVGEWIQIENLTSQGEPKYWISGIEIQRDDNVKNLVTSYYKNL